VLLGLDQVRKWASVWALAGLNGGASSEIVTIAILRARSCELVASDAFQRATGLPGYRATRLSDLGPASSRPTPLVPVADRAGGDHRQNFRGESGPPTPRQTSQGLRQAPPLISPLSPWLVAGISCRAARGWDRYASRNEYRIHATSRIAVQYRPRAEMCGMMDRRLIGPKAEPRARSLEPDSLIAR
jgi:hypothetical protein